jgi:hypothetical protein
MDECNVKSHEPDYRSFEWALSYMKTGGRVQHRNHEGTEFYLDFRGVREPGQCLGARIDPRMHIVVSDGATETTLLNLKTSDILDNVWAPVPVHGSWDWAVAQMEKGRTVTCSRLGPVAVAYIVKSPTQLDHKHSATNVSLGVSRLLNSPEFRPFVVVESVMGIRLPNDEDKKQKDWRLK